MADHKILPKIPVGFHPDLGPDGGMRCCSRNGPKTRYCRRKAGWGTDHFGAGRCFQHGGLTPITTGRYSGIKRQSVTDAIKQLREHERDPLDLNPELEMQRALLHDFIERYDKFTEALIAWHESNGPNRRKPIQIMDIADASRMIGNISRVVETINRLHPPDTIRLETLKRIMDAMGEKVAKHVTDEKVLQAIMEDWGSLRLEAPKAGTVEVSRQQEVDEREVTQSVQ